MTRITLPAPQWTDRNRQVAGPMVTAPLDAEDLARVLTTFRGQPTRATPPLRYVRSRNDGDAGVYVLDEHSGITYILD